jgi:hypothetical protein
VVRVPGACAVRVLVPALVSVLKSFSVARSAHRGTEVRSSKTMNEQDVGEHVAGARSKVAVVEPARLGAIRVREVECSSADA